MPIASSNSAQSILDIISKKINGITKRLDSLEDKIDALPDELLPDDERFDEFVNVMKQVEEHMEDILNR